MLNPFSMYYGQACTGKEINDWCCYQIENNTLYYKEAVRLLKKSTEMIEHIINFIK